MSSQFVISSPQPQQGQQSPKPEQPQQCDPITKKGQLTTVELLWLLCKKATRELGSTDMSILGLDGFLLNEVKDLRNEGRWENKALGIGWAVSPELYYLILLNIGMNRIEIEQILKSKFNILNPICIRERLIRHNLFSEFFERNNSMLKFKSALEGKAPEPMDYPAPSILSFAPPPPPPQALSTSPALSQQSQGSSQALSQSQGASQGQSQSQSPSPTPSQQQQPIYQQSVPTFSQPPAAQPHEHKKLSLFSKKNKKDKEKEKDKIVISAPQQQVVIQPQQVAPPPVIAASGPSVSVSVGIDKKKEDKKKEDKKDKSNEDRLVSHDKSRYISYENFESFKDLITFGQRVTMKIKTFFDDRGGFDGYYLYVEDAPLDARYPVFLDKSQVKMCNGCKAITGRVVQAKPVVISSARNVYKMKPGEFIYALILEGIEVDKSGYY